MSYTFYTDLAKYYDKIYHYVDYEQQAEFFIKLINKFVPNANNKILDFACGTGTHAGILDKKGFEVTGVDLSPEMLAKARKKYPNIKFHLGNMKNWNGSTKFAAIIIFFNSILYNKSKDELKATLKNCYDQLQKNGLLIFDTVDKSIGINSEKQEFKYSDKKLDISFSPQWVYDRSKNYMDLEIDFIINGKKVHDHHTMGAFTLAEQEQLAANAGFKVLLLERRFDRVREIPEKDKKAVFVCRKI